MPRVGLSYGSDLLNSAAAGLGADPSRPFNPDRTPTGLSRLAGLAPQSNVVSEYANQLDTELSSFNQPTAPPAPAGPSIYFSPSTRRLHVNGFTFDEDNASDALASREALTNGTPDGPPDDAADWRQLMPGEYENYINSIENPGITRLAGEGFQRGLRGLGALWGAGQQFLGFEEAGQRTLDTVAQGFERDAPYQRNFTEIDNAGDFAEWFASAVGEAGPSIIESLIVMAGGALAGSAAPGAGTVAGAGAGLIGRTALREQIMRGVAEHAALSQALRRSSMRAIENHFAERVATGAMTREAAQQAATDIAVMRSSSRWLGTTIASLANNTGIGTADIYNELRQAGADPGDANARLLALTGAIPYATLETVPDLLFARALTGTLRGPTNVFARIPAYAAAGLGTETVAEGGQEAITTGATAAYTGQEWLTPDTQERIINAAAAGGAAGALMGGIGGISPQHPTNLLNPTENVEPPAPAPQESANIPLQVPPNASWADAATFGSPFPANEYAPAPAPPITPLPPMGGLPMQEDTPEPVVAPGAARLRAQGTSLAGATNEELNQQLQTSQDPEYRRAIIEEMDARAKAPSPEKGKRSQARKRSRAAKRLAEIGKGRVGDVTYEKSTDVEYQPTTQKNENYGSPGMIFPNPTGGNESKLTEKEIARAKELEQRLLLDKLSDKEYAEYNKIRARVGLRPTDAEETAFREAELVRTDTEANEDTTIPEAARIRKGLSEIEKQIAEEPAGKQRLKKQPVQQLSTEEATKEVTALSEAVRAKTRTRASVLGTLNGYITAAKSGKKSKYSLATAQKMRDDFKAEFAETEKPAAPEQKEKLNKLKAKTKAKKEASKSEEAKPQVDKTEKRKAELTELAKAHKAAPRGIKRAQALADLQRDARSFKKLAPEAVKQWIEENENNKDLAEEVNAVRDATKDGPVRFAPRVSKKSSVEALVDEALERWGGQKELPQDYNVILSRTEAGKITSRAGRPPTLSEKAETISPNTIRVYITNARRGVFGKAIQKKAEQLPWARTGHSDNFVSAFIGKFIDQMEQEGRTLKHSRQAPLKASQRKAAGVWTRDDLITALHKEQQKQGRDLTDQNVALQLIKRVLDGRVDNKGRYAANEAFEVIDERTGKVVTPIELEAARTYVEQVADKINKLQTVNVHVYKNAQELKADNKALFDKTKKSVNDLNDHMAFIIGNDMVVFSDNMYTKQQIAFTVGHELVGHFGIRVLFAQDEKAFQAFLDKVYEASPMVRERVEQILASERTTDKHEAIEEAIADVAGELESDLFQRVITWVKRALHKLFGIKFSDEIVYAMIDASRTFMNNPNAQPLTLESLRFAPKKPPTQKEIDEAAAEQARRDTAQNLATITATDSMMDPNTTEETIEDRFQDLRKQFSAEQLKDNITTALNKYVHTLGDVAQKSPMIKVLAQILHDTAGRKLDLVTLAQSLREQTLKHEWFGGPTRKDLQEAADMLAASTLHLMPQYDEAKASKPLLAIDKTGNVTFDEKAYEEHENAGILTPEQFNSGVQTYYSDGSKGKLFKFNGITKDSKSYQVYLENRKVINRLAREKLMDAAQGAGLMTDERIANILSRVQGLKRDITKEDIKWLSRVSREFQRISLEGTEVKGKKRTENESAAAQANDWLVDVLKAYHIADKAEEFNKKYNSDGKYDAILAGMKEARTLGVTKDQQYQILNAVQTMGLDSAALRAQEALAIKTIRTYVPLIREGQYQVRVRAVTEKDTPANLHEDLKAMLPAYKFPTLADAAAQASTLSKVFGDTVYDAYDSDNEPIKVKFVAVREKATDAPDLAEGISVEQFKTVADRIGLKITPKDWEKIVVALTQAGASQRKALERSGNPGWNRDVIKGISQWLETTSSISSKMRYRNELTNLLRNDKLLYGDPEELKRLQDNFDKAKNEAARKFAEDELLRYARAYSFVSPIENEKDTFTVRTRRGELTFKHQGRGNEAKDIANSLMMFYHKRLDITEDVEDLLGKYGAPIRTMAFTFQLAGTVAAGVVNMTSLALNLAPYLAGTNTRTGRGIGDGFGDVAAMDAIVTGARKMAGVKFGERTFWEKMIEDRSWGKHGLTETEARTMAHLTINGVMQASQQNALLGTTRTKITGRLFNAFIRAFGKPFSAVEEFNRRVTAYATWKLLSERALAAGYTEEQLRDHNSDIYKKLYSEVFYAIEYTQGNYALYNRPKLFRGNITNPIFMYKMFPLTTIELIGQLPTRQQVQMLALLALVAGLKGLPFADDLMDMIDGLMQRLGIRAASVEAELASMIDTVLPGASTLVMRGVLDQYTGGTFSTRLGLGDLIPFTGLMRENADVGRELESGFGPIYSVVTQTWNYAGLLADMGLEGVGLKDRTHELSDIIRQSPIAGVRQFEGLLWAIEGEMTDRSGRTISTETPALAAATRLLGFYPSEATRANDVVRLSRYVDDYAKRIRARYINAWAAAHRNGDTQRMREIERDVSEWNRQSRQAGREEFIVKEFRRAALRSAGERNRPTVERYQRTTNRPSSDELARIYGFE